MVIGNKGELAMATRSDSTWPWCHPLGPVRLRDWLVDCAVFEHTVDYPDEFSPGYHVILDGGQVITVRWDQLAGRLESSGP